MLPVLFKLRLPGGVLWLPGFAAMVLTGAIVALALALRRSQGANLPTRPLLFLFLPALGLGFVGARFGSFLQEGGMPFRGGLVLYGGLLVGLAVLLVGAAGRGLPPLRVADLAAPLALLGAGFGRLGCFFAGCCYGTVAPLGLSYPRGSHAFRDHVAHGWIEPTADASLPTVPMPLLEAGALFLLSVVLSRVWQRRKSTPGFTLALAGILYPSWRFVAEFWRGDNELWGGLPFTFSQGVSLLLLVLSGLSFARGFRAVPLVLVSPSPLSPRWLPAASLLALLVFGGVTCSSPASHPQERWGETVLHPKAAPQETPKHDPKSSPGKTEPKNSDEDSQGDYIGDCIGDCISDCIGDCIDENCQCSGGGKGTQSLGPAKIPPVRPGLYQGAAGLEANLNGRMEVKLRLQGVIQVLDRVEGEPLKIHLIANEVVLDAGDVHVKGKGEMEMLARDGFHLSVVRSDLPAELLGNLRSLEPLLGDLLRIETPTPSIPALREEIQAQLKNPDLRVDGLANLAITGQDRTYRATAQADKTESGDIRIRWSVTH